MDSNISDIIDGINSLSELKDKAEILEFLSSSKTQYQICDVPTEKLISEINLSSSRQESVIHFDRDLFLDISRSDTRHQVHIFSHKNVVIDIILKNCSVVGIFKRFVFPVYP